MVDVPILASTLKAVRNGSAVILVGDVDQLPRSVPDRCWPTSSAPAWYPWCG